MTPLTQRIYNTLFPYYIEVCALSQLHQKSAKPGGWGGHATLFLNGAVIEAGAGYPRLRLADAGADLSHPDSGVGVSVNRVFANVAWVAIPGRDEFFRGGLAPGQTLNAAAYDAAVERAAEAGWFAGIAILDAVMRLRPRAMTESEYIVRRSIGTDFALCFGRTTYSARLPMSATAMAATIGYLNGVNDGARKSGFVWNAYTSNCSHIAHNALAAPGVWDPKEARPPGRINVAKDVLSIAKAFALGRMSNFAFPANSFVRLYEAGNERPIADPVAAFHNRDIRRTLSDGWLCTGPGALIASQPMHDEPRNELFTRGRDPLLVSVPMLWDKREKFHRLTRDAPATVTELGANLTEFRDRYARTLARERTVDDLPAFDEGDEFEIFYDRFLEHIAEEQRRNDERIAVYERLVSA